MAESPVKKIGRLLGGIALTQGRLGHQVLGQLLLAGSNDAEIAGASVVVTGTSGDRDAVSQVALRTAAPALAVAALFKRREEQLERFEAKLAQRASALDTRERALAAPKIAAGQAAVPSPATDLRVAELTALVAKARVDLDAALAERSGIEAAAERLHAELETAKAREAVAAAAEEDTHTRLEAASARLVERDGAITELRAALEVAHQEVASAEARAEAANRRRATLEAVVVETRAHLKAAEARSKTARWIALALRRERRRLIKRIAVLRRTIVQLKRHVAPKPATIVPSPPTPSAPPPPTPPSEGLPTRARRRPPKKPPRF